jgi:hypothetical protein
MLSLRVIDVSVNPFLAGARRPAFRGRIPRQAALSY